MVQCRELIEIYINSTIHLLIGTSFRNSSNIICKHLNAPNSGIEEEVDLIYKYLKMKTSTKLVQSISNMMYAPKYMLATLTSKNVLLAWSV